MNRFATALAVAAAVAAAFSPPHAASRPSAPCPSLAEATHLKTAGPTLRGDLDGDGRPDRVSVVYAPNAPGTCGILLLARTGHVDRAVRLVGIFRGPARYSIQFGVPRLLGVLRLDHGASREIVVEVDEGAHAA